MKSLRKTSGLGIRMTKAQRRKLREAAMLESRRRGGLVSSGELLLELAWPGVEQILAPASAEAQVA